MLQTNQELTESVKLEPVQTAEQEADGRRGCSRSTKQAGAPSGSALSNWVNEVTHPGSSGTC